MKINVYLPDKLGEKAKSNNLNLSKLLRYEVQKTLLELELLKLKKNRGNVTHNIRLGWHHEKVQTI